MDDKPEYPEYRFAQLPANSLFYHDKDLCIKVDLPNEFKRIKSKSIPFSLYEVNAVRLTYEPSMSHLPLTEAVCIQESSQCFLVEVRIMEKINELLKVERD